MFLCPKDLYLDRPLPFLIGSQAFMEQEDVGLGDLSSDGSVFDYTICKITPSWLELSTGRSNGHPQVKRFRIGGRWHKMANRSLNESPQLTPVTQRCPELAPKHYFCLNEKFLNSLQHSYLVPGWHKSTTFIELKLHSSFWYRSQDGAKALLL